MLELELVEFLEDAVSEGKATPGQERHMQCFPFSTLLYTGRTCFPHPPQVGSKGFWRRKQSLLAFSVTLFTRKLLPCLGERFFLVDTPMIGSERNILSRSCAVVWV
ncbi:hypothetical protein DsansV1_C25g0187971 [Dioscorea sansibarensis]